MFAPKNQTNVKETVVEKSFMGIDKLSKWTWWKEEMSYLFLPTSQITEVKIVIASNDSFNVYARLDLKDRFEYKLIDNKKTLAAAKKLSEEFIKMIYKDGKENELPDALKALADLKNEINKKPPSPPSTE